MTPVNKDTLDPRREEGLRRYRIIAPLLEAGLVECEKRPMRRLICAQEGLSPRSLRRYVAAFQRGGFDALLPGDRKDKGVSRAIPPEAMALAVDMRRELPARSAERVKQLLASEGYHVARSTLERHLRQQGLSGREIQAERKQVTGRRFNRQGRNTLWQSDMKYGPYLPDPGRPAHKIRTYLVAMIDDATRLVSHGEFYDNQRLPTLEDTLRKAILKCGLPDSLYVDQGKIFVSRWLRLACAKLRIRHLNTQPYSPEAKGKIERWNRTVDEFIREAALERPQTLEQLNGLFRAWLSEGYNHREHSALAGKSPAQAFTEDTKSLRFPSPEALREAFLWEKSPRVDKTGCISLNGLCYEVGLEYVRKPILARYDPFDLSQVEVWYGGAKKKLVSPINIGEYNRNVKKPVEDLEKASQSRLLRLFAAESKKRLKQQLGAFRLSEEENHNDHV
ncbi:MAG: DDE-type integrase/transposase/recombinase [Dehalococcoidales bacterium]|nr:DDE-type integrase/transposase/recombinase [Dehalococcoidales bacterium]